MKIKVVFTGGTIGSSQNGGVVSADGMKPKHILEMYKRKFPFDAEISWETCFPYEELSENLTCRLLGRLIVYLRDNCIDRDDDGIIVTHGTDPRQYAAAALSYCFGDLSIPIVLVSSNYILEDERSNGFENFVHAAEFIKCGGRGVFVSYRNSGECAKIHCGTRVISHKAYSDEVESLNGIEYGYFDDERFKVNNKFSMEYGNTDICKIFRDSFETAGDGQDEFSDVLWIRPYVGMRYPRIPKDVKAVLHDSYHSGTICSKAVDLAGFAAEAQRKNVQIFVCGCGGSAFYESKKIYEELGFNVLPIASPIAMYIKLWLCVKSGLDLNCIMKGQLCGDIINY